MREGEREKGQNRKGRERWIKVERWEVGEREREKREEPISMEVH